MATKIVLGFLIAISIDLLDSFVNYLLTLRVKTTSEFLLRSEAVIRHSGALNKDMVKMQSAFRGFLLTGDRQFLQPFEEGLKELPNREKQMRQMATLPRQVVIADSILILHNRWVEYAGELIEARKNSATGVRPSEDFSRLLETRMGRRGGEEYSGRLATLFNAFDETEYQQRDLRRKELAESIDRTDRYSLLFSVLLVLVGVSIALWLVRNISRRIGPLVRLAERISQGDFGRVNDAKRDELSSLSVSLNRMSEKLSSTIGELEKKNAELNQFAYVVSHDLKAPVRGISNVVRWIEEDHAAEITPTVRKYLDYIPDRIARMEALIDGILEYARAGREGTVKEAVNVGDLVAELTEMAVPEGFIVQAGTLPVVFTERLPMQQVFGNLIGNSVKYGSSGTTVITVTGADRGPYYEFTVGDNGPGIEPEYHEKIFGLFQTLREKADKESTGIGLSIVKKIVEERGGAIRVVSSPGNGAKFIFTWPKSTV